METFFARKVLLAEGWADNVRLRTDGGRLARIETGSTPEPGELETGIVIPGVCNAHSHAFQRALAGHTEYPGPAATDTFWTWRQRMYALAGQIDADALCDIARQAYTEMVATGYTSVVEFHYLHGASAGQSVSGAMLEALLRAADDSGIRMTFVPVLYERGDFDDPSLSSEQQRFALSLDSFLAHYANASAAIDEPHAIGIGAHSLRAVSKASLDVIVSQSAADDVPLHIHVAEQQREVDGCVSVYKARPVYWLLDNFDVDERWTMVHATHMDAEEVVLLAQSGAVACLCPSTEANLGDGIFRLREYLESDGRIAIGSDSHVTINPFEELRWLEYGQRLIERRRNVAASSTASSGRSLFLRAVDGGGRAAGRQSARLEEGGVADLIALDDDSPMLAGHDAASLLDALVFSGFTLPIDRVMVAGIWRVTDGAHRGASAAYERYAAALRRLDVGGTR